MYRWLLLAGTVFSLDQISKLLCLQQLVLYKPIAVIPGFNLLLSYNEGAAFGLLAHENGWQRVLFISLALIISVIIISWLYKQKKKNTLESLALALILGGAIGNLVDRIWHKSVIDFIDLYISNWHWYTFNIADIAICLGAAIFAVITLDKDVQKKD